jgi:hypothetical protein
MNSIIYSFIILFLSTSALEAQFVWTELTDDENLPTGVQLFRGDDSADRVRAYYLLADMNEPSIIVHPFLGQAQATTTFTNRVGAIAAINAGYFNVTTGESVSALVSPGGVVGSINGLSVVRDGLTYPTTRAFFAIHDDKSMSVDWIYHFGNTIDDLYWYSEPTQNVPGTPAPTPTRAQGNLYENLLMGVGAGPVLVKNGKVNYTYDEEGFFGNSGLVGGERRPRTAVGFTSDNKVIMLVVDSGSIISGTPYRGLSLPQVADLMISLGAIEAMNLDGGGSSTMAVGSKLINRPNGGTSQRPVPTILSIISADSLRLPPPPLGEVIIDTEDTGVTFTGADWFQTANFSDSYGGAASASWLVAPGDGSQFVEYKPDLLNAKYEVFGWWSASSNRTSNTPYTISHAEGSTTIRVNQQINNAQWISLGEFLFTGTEADRVVISNDATGGNFVVADAIRFVQTEQAIVSIEKTDERPTTVRLHQNYPNPFNPTTTISFELPEPSQVNLHVFDITGRLVQTVYSGFMSTGNHAVQFNARDLPSGNYVYVLNTDLSREIRMMTLIK